MPEIYREIQNNLIEIEALNMKCDSFNFYRMIRETPYAHKTKTAPRIINNQGNIISDKQEKKFQKIT